MADNVVPAVPPPPAGPPQPAAPSLVYDAALKRLAVAQPGEANKEPARYQQVGDQETIMVAPDGKQFNISASDAQGMLAQGFTFLPHEQAAHEAAIDFYKKKFVGSDAAGAASTFVMKFVNQATFGAAGAAERHYNEQQYGSAANDAWERIEAEHKTAALAGNIGGFATGAVLGAGLGSIAKGAQAGAEGAQAVGLGSRLLGAAGRGAVEGAAYAAPQTLVHAAYGDVDHAAESLLWGAGMGGILGLGSGALSAAARSGEALAMRKAVGAGLIDEAGTLLPESGQQALFGGGKTKAQAMLEGLAPGIADKAEGAVAKGIGGLAAAGGSAVAGPLGGMAAYKGASALAKRVLDGAADGIVARGMKGLADHPEGLQYLGRALANGTASAAAERIGSTASTLLTAGAVEADPIKRLLGSSANGLTKDQQFDRVTRALAQVDAQQEIGHMGGLFGLDPELKQAIAAKQEQAVAFLKDSMPKQPPPQPFQRGEWTPTPQEKKAFLDKLEVTQDPWSVLRHVAGGTLTPGHVAAMDAIYPTLKGQIVQQVGQMAYDPKAPLPAPGVRQGLSMLTGVDMTNPTKINFQALYPPPHEGGGAPPPSKHKAPGSSRAGLKDTPSMATQTARLEFK